MKLPISLQRATAPPLLLRFPPVFPKLGWQASITAHRSRSIMCQPLDIFRKGRVHQPDITLCVVVVSCRAAAPAKRAVRQAAALRPHAALCSTAASSNTRCAGGGSCSRCRSRRKPCRAAAAAGGQGCWSGGVAGGGYCSAVVYGGAGSSAEQQRCQTGRWVSLSKRPANAVGAAHGGAGFRCYALVSVPSC